MRTAFYKQVIAAIEKAGCELARRNNSHDIYRSPSRQNIVVPRKLDDKRIARALLKLAGA